jgi:hypothetical protein
MENKTVVEQVNSWVENYAFRVPYDGSTEYYDESAIKHGKAGFIAGRESANEQIKTLITDKKELIEVLRTFDNLRHSLGLIQASIEGEQVNLKEAWNLISDFITNSESTLLKHN